MLFCIFYKKINLNLLKITLGAEFLSILTKFSVIGLAKEATANGCLSVKFTPY